MIEKNKGGRGKKSPESRRNSPRIAIARSYIEKVDNLAKEQGCSRADIVEQAIDAFEATFPPDREPIKPFQQKEKPLSPSNDDLPF